MRDGPFRRALKAVARWTLLLELQLRRRWAAARGERRWVLGGTCGGCAKCCEAPSIQVGKLTWYLPRLRKLFLGWQRVINGFELVEADRAGRVFTFRCTHFDPETRRCDSYASRPTMCRDYPRALLDQPWPEFFQACGFRPVAKDGTRQLEVLKESGLSEEQLAEFREKFHLE